MDSDKNYEVLDRDWKDEHKCCEMPDSLRIERDEEENCWKLYRNPEYSYFERILIGTIEFEHNDEVCGFCGQSLLNSITIQTYAPVSYIDIDFKLTKEGE